jgi:glutamine amidotransferase PdxT
MNTQKIAIESLAMDLKRVAIGLQRKSFTMANRFKEEAISRKDEIRGQGIQDTYLERLISGVEKTLTSTDERVAEDALMYSTLFQNFAQKKFS